MTKIHITTILFLLLQLSLHAQQKAVNLTIESFYADENVITSKDYNSKDFRDVHPFAPGDYLQRGVEKLDSEFYEEALVDFTEAISLAPDCAICYYYRANNYLIMDSLESAKQDYLKAVEYDPVIIEGYNDLAHVYSLQNNLDSAKYILKKGIDYFPNYALTYHNLGVLETLKDKPNRALKQFKKCLKIDPCHKASFLWMMSIYLYKNNLSKADAIMNKALDCDAEASEYYMFKSLIKLLRGKINAAIENISAAIEIEEVYYYPYVRGLLQTSKNNYDLAVVDFSKAYELNPLESEDYKGGYSYKREQKKYQYVMSYYLKHKGEFNEKLRHGIEKGICKLIVEEDREAAAIFKKLIKKNKKNALLHLLLGLSYENVYKKDLAFESHSNCINLDDGISEAYKRRGLLNQSRGRYKEAVLDFDKMYSMDSYSSEALKYRGVARFLKGEVELALEDFNEYDLKFMADGDVLYNIGQCYTKLGKSKDAIRAFKKLLIEKPKDTDALCRIAELNYGLGNYEQVISTCDTIHTIMECHVIAFNLKGIIFLQNSKLDDALYNFNQAINCSPLFCDGYINRSSVYFNLGKHQLAMQDINKAISIDSNQGLAYLLRAGIKKEMNDRSSCEDLRRAISLGMVVTPEDEKQFCQ